MQQSKHIPLFLWYCLRALDRTGCGRIDLEDAARELVDRGIYTRTTFYRHLRLAEGKLVKVYDNGRAVVEIYGLSVACQWFSIHKLSKYRDMPLSDVRGLSIKALLWNTGAYRPEGVRNDPISRRSLEEKTKVPERNQQRYDVMVQAVKQETLVKSYDPNLHRYFTQTITVRHQNKNIRLRRQKGNIYTSHATQSNRGMLRKVTRLAKERQGLSLVRGEAPDNILTPSRCYFSTFKDWVSSHVKGKAGMNDCYYPLKSKRTVYVECFAL